MLAVLVGLSFAPLNSQIPVEAVTPPAIVRGQVVDHAGVPVPGAHVVVGCQGPIPFDPFALLAEASTDVQGGFALELPGEWVDRFAVYRSLEVFATAEAHGMVLQRWDVGDVPVGLDWTLKLPEHPRSRIRLVDTTGAPLVGARVYPHELRSDAVGIFHIPEAWWVEHAPTTDEQGWALLPVPLTEVVTLGFAEKNCGIRTAYRNWQLPGSFPEVIQVAPLVERSIQLPTDVPKGARLTVKSVDDSVQQNGESLNFRFFDRRLLDNSEAIKLLAPPGALMVTIRSEDSSVLALEWARFDVNQAAAPIVIYRSQAPFVLVGRAVDATDGSPVPGVRLLVRGAQEGWVTSDGLGRFHAAIAVAKCYADSFLSPPGYFGRYFWSREHIEAKDGSTTIDLGDVQIERCYEATGRVLSADGHPLQGVWVVGQQRPGSNGRVEWLSATTDADGRFRMRGALAGAELKLTARTPRGLAQGSIADVTTGESPDLILTPTLSARGVLVDRDGKPLSGVRVQVRRAAPPSAGGGERVLLLAGVPYVETDGQGNFETPASLEPEERYLLSWSGPSAEVGRSDWFSTQELGAGVQLVGARLSTIRGVLRGADGAPLAGAAVRLRRAGTETVTAADGSFELQRVPAEGDVLLVKDASGLRSIRWAEPGDEELDWQVLPPNNEVPLVAQPAPDRAQELEIAHKLLSGSLQRALETGNESEKWSAMKNFTQVDPGEAMSRVEAGFFETDWMRDAALTHVANALRDASPQEALAVAMRIGPSAARSLSILETAERLAPQAELEQLAIVRADSRAVDPPEKRLVVLARLADRLLDLGEHEAAAEVLEEGRVLAPELPATEWPAYARGAFAEVLARVDLEAALALIHATEANEDIPRHLGNAAQKLAAVAPAKAEELLAEVEKSEGAWRADRYASRVAHAMATVDLERARRIAGKYDRTGYADGMIALALGESNRSEALASLEHAFARAEALSPREQAWNEPVVATCAALLSVAEVVDPQGLRGWIARAVAIERPAEEASSDGVKATWVADAALAFHLTRWDPILARKILEPAVADVRSQSSDPFGGTRVIWAAAAVVDPVWAGELATELGGRAASVIGLILAMPRESRAQYVQDEYIDLWVVGKEDI